MKCRFPKIDRECPEMECVDCLVNMHEQQHIEILNLKDKLHKRNVRIKKLKTQLDNITVSVFRGCVDTVKADGKIIEYTIEDMD